MQKAADYIVKNSRAKGKCAVLKTLMIHPGIESEVLESESGASKAVLRELVKQELVTIEDRAIERNPFAGTELLRTEPLPPTEEQAAEFDPDELQDARLALRPVMERSAVDRVQSAYGNKYDPLVMYDSKRDVANLLMEEAEARSVREFLRKQHKLHGHEQQRKTKHDRER